jgi:hypothetical protein
MSNNAVGLLVDGATVRLSYSLITNNETGIRALHDGKVVSITRNTVEGNDADGVALQRSPASSSRR